MDASEIISLVLTGCKVKGGDNRVLFVGNDSGTSFYATGKGDNRKSSVQIRISNHETSLDVWKERAKLENGNDPSLCTNISIVFIDDEGDDNIPCIRTILQGFSEVKEPYTVLQYTYQSKPIESEHIGRFVDAIIDTIANGEYVEPLGGLLF